MARQNFIIFNPDEWRGDYAGCYGHPVIQTPNLDRLAAEGTRFGQCHAQHTVCTASRCSFMTGWYPHTAGHRSLWHCLRPHEPNLLRYLKRHGYEVAWFGKNDLLSQDAFEASVDWWGGSQAAYPPDVPRPEPIRTNGESSFLFTPHQVGLEQLPDSANVDRAIAFLRRPRDRPFMLYLPLTLPHCPYTVPQPWYDLYDPQQMPPLRPTRGNGAPSFYRRIRETRRLDRATDWVLPKVNAVYAGMITAVDTLLGRLLDAVDALGLTDSTTVLVFSDHGDWAGDYGLVEKWSAGLDDCLTRVPLVIRSPGGKAGHVVEEPVELFDQMATVLELANIEAEHTHFARSLTPQLHGESGDADRSVFADGGYGRHEPHILEGNPARNDPITQNASHHYFPKLRLQQTEPLTTARCQMIRTRTHKLVRRPETGEHELYDLVSDPHESRNRFDDAEVSDVRRELETRLLDRLIETSDVSPWNEDPRQPPPARRWDETKA